MTHIPKGSMCQGCSKLKQDCSHLEFANMQKIKDYKDGVSAVKCTEFEPVKAKNPLRGFGVELDIQSGRVRNWTIGEDGMKRYV